MPELDHYLKRIREIRPELVIERASLNREGLLNDVVIVNDAFVFRFAKRDYGTFCLTGGAGASTASLTSFAPDWATRRRILAAFSTTTGSHSWIVSTKSTRRRKRI